MFEALPLQKHMHNRLVESDPVNHLEVSENELSPSLDSYSVLVSVRLDHTHSRAAPRGINPTTVSSIVKHLSACPVWTSDFQFSGWNKKDCSRVGVFLTPWLLASHIDMLS